MGHMNNEFGADSLHAAVSEYIAHDERAAPFSLANQDRSPPSPTAESPGTSEPQSLSQSSTSCNQTESESDEVQPDQATLPDYSDADEQVKKRWACILTIMKGDKYKAKKRSGKVPPYPDPTSKLPKRKWELAMAEWRNSLAEDEAK